MTQIKKNNNKKKHVVTQVFLNLRAERRRHTHTEMSKVVQTGLACSARTFKVQKSKTWQKRRKRRKTHI